VDKLKAQRALLKRLIAQYPRCFIPDGERRRPLKVGLAEDILAANPEIDQRNLSYAIGLYVNNFAYESAVTEGADRVGLDGATAGVVTQLDVEHARARGDGRRARLKDSNDKAWAEAWAARAAGRGRAKWLAEKAATSRGQSSTPRPPTRPTIADKPVQAAGRSANQGQASQVQPTAAPPVAERPPAAESAETLAAAKKAEAERRAASRGRTILTLKRAG
jgi:ProP effector